jgi:hypothetical protein
MAEEEPKIEETKLEDLPIEKNNVGRPLKFKTVKELEDKIQEYFESCFEEVWEDTDKRDEDGNLIYDLSGKVEKEHIKVKKCVRPLTITGLAVALDTYRSVLLDYEEKDEYSNTIKKAKETIQNFVEERLFGGNVAGPIFNLINNWKGWSNKQEITGKDGKDLIPEPDTQAKINESITKILNDKGLNN